MQNDRRRLALYLALGATLMALLYPPFSYGIGGIGEAMQYGFVLSGPPAAEAARAMAGTDSPASDLISYSIDTPLLLLELALVWGLYAALLMTVLRRPSPGT